MLGLSAAGHWLAATDPSSAMVTTATAGRAVVVGSALALSFTLQP